jgi:hypothetical protein
MKAQSLFLPVKCVKKFEILMLKKLYQQQKIGYLKKLVSE